MSYFIILLLFYYFIIIIFLQCNRTKNNESTFFILNVIIGKLIVQNWVLLNLNEYAKRSAESILMLYIYRPLFP